jgi:hypothetical protein
MEIQEYETATQSYKQLVNLEHLVGSDSWELYKTIQKGNNRTEEIRKKFLESLQKLENDLGQE